MKRLFLNLNTGVYLLVDFSDIPVGSYEDKLRYYNEFYKENLKGSEFKIHKSIKSMTSEDYKEIGLDNMSGTDLKGKEALEFVMFAKEGYVFKNPIKKIKFWQFWRFENYGNYLTNRNSHAIHELRRFKEETTFLLKVTE